MTKRRDDFPYSDRAAAVEAARREADRTFRLMTKRQDDSDLATLAWQAALGRFHAALASAYPTAFWDDVERLATGDAAGLESAIGFLEADPVFFRSGYVKADLIRHVKRQPLDEHQRRRLEAVILSVVDRRDGREFRHYCRLTRRIAGDSLRAGLNQRLGAADPGVRRRAGWVLDAMGEPGPPHRR
jgi:hypothetical protein